MKRVIVGVLCLVFVLLWFSTNAANASPVWVEMPRFKVKLNDQLVDNENSKYPLLIYKGITYFPMTWNYARSLGLTTHWDPATGFSVSKDPNASAVTVVQDLGTRNDINQRFEAVLPGFNIKVNGKSIDNGAEEYPLLVVRGITYFPMTWRFAVEEFGLVTAWDNVEGFSIERNFSLTTNKEGAGQVLPGNTVYKAYSQVTVVAVPDTGWKFSRWLGDVADSNSRVTTVLMNGNKKVTAVFERIRYTLSIATEGMGEVVSYPNSSFYDVNSKVTVTAKPSVGWQFERWIGDVADPLSATTTITVTQNTLLKAVFRQQPAKVKTVEEIAKEGKAVVQVETLDEQGIVKGTGSGFIVTSDGVLVTNYHVIDKASRVRIKLDTGVVHEVIGVLIYDIKQDYAVLRVGAQNLPVVTLGSSTNIETGQKVVAIGSPFGLQNSVSDGIISSKSRVIEGVEMIQMTTPISPGSSGGALFNMEGEVIGITTATRVGGQNLNLALPIDVIKTPLASVNSLRLISFTELKKIVYPRMSYTEFSAYLFNNFSAVKVGQDTIYLDRLWVRESNEGDTVFIFSDINATNYVKLLQARLAGNTAVLEIWFKAILARTMEEYPDKKVFGGTTFFGTFYSYPTAFPAKSIKLGPNLTWEVSYTFVWFYNIRDGLYVDWE